MAVLGAFMFALSASLSSGLAGQSGAWKTTLLPGLRNLNIGHDASITDISCPSQGNCSVIGYFSTPPPLSYLGVFGENEVRGRWMPVEKVSGYSPLDGIPVFRISCMANGDCVAAGSSRFGRSYDYQAAYVASHNGKWGRITEVPGVRRLNLGGNARVNAISCTSATFCVLGGQFQTSGPLGGRSEAFVSEGSPTGWSSAIAVPETTRRNRGPDAAITSVSCTSEHFCAAAGYLSIGQYQERAFVVDWSHGTWNHPIFVAGLRRPSIGVKVACSSAGNCVLGGQYYERGRESVPMIAEDRAGIWHHAMELPGMKRLNVGHAGYVFALACPRSGDCVVGGAYSDKRKGYQSFVETESHWKWSSARELPGTSTLNSGADTHNFGNDDAFMGLSCTSVGNCVGGGDYVSSKGDLLSFVAVERMGVWSNAEPTPGVGHVDLGHQAIFGAIACAGEHYCVVGGDASDGRGFQAVLSIHS
jgi:hypothetical protein